MLRMDWVVGSIPIKTRSTWSVGALDPDAECLPMLGPGLPNKGGAITAPGSAIRKFRSRFSSRLDVGVLLKDVRDDRLLLRPL